LTPIEEDEELEILEGLEEEEIKLPRPEPEDELIEEE
jgi:hypothetical protein